MNTKYVFSTAFIFLFSYIVNAQVAIGKNSVDGDGLLDFTDSDKRGIVLPWITSEMDVLSPVGGTLIFDSNDKKVKYYNGNEWISLSIRPGTVDTSLQDSLNDVGNGIILGNSTTSANGVLVLESDNKALILPKVDDVALNVLSPEAGTIVYDPSLKAVCVFNGSEWTFWGEN